MELKEFVSHTLTQIAEGIQEAINASEGKGYLVSPTTDEIGNSCNIHFNIAVENEADGKTGIKVISGGISKRSANRPTSWSTSAPHSLLIASLTTSRMLCPYMRKEWHNPSLTTSRMLCPYMRKEWHNRNSFELFLIPNSRITCSYDIQLNEKQNVPQAVNGHCNRYDISTRDKSLMAVLHHIYCLLQA